MALSRREDGAALLLKINYQDEDRGIGEGKRRIARIEGNDEEKVVEEEAEGEERVSTATAKDERASFGTGPSSSMLTNLLSVTTHTRKCSMRDVRSPRSPEDI